MVKIWNRPAAALQRGAETAIVPADLMADTITPTDTKPGPHPDESATGAPEVTAPASEGTDGPDLAV